MGFPSEGTEGIYRNKMSDVIRFFDERHTDHYKVYNLCSERQYDHAKFHNRVARFPFDDHNPPPIGLMLDFCRDLEQWFAASEENIAVVHCKAGKGRTGVMIACWLQYGGMWQSAGEALTYYGAARTKDQKGVTIPSQIRYVHYFETICREGGLRSTETLYLKRLRLTSIPALKQLHFIIQHGFDKKDKVFTSPVIRLNKKTMEAPLDWDVHAPLVGEVKLVFYEKKDKAFSCWINASYIDDGHCVIRKSELDGAIKDKKHKIFAQEFCLELFCDTPVVPTKPSTGPLGIGGDRAADAYFDDVDQNVDLADDEEELRDADANARAAAGPATLIDGELSDEGSAVTSSEASSSAASEASSVE